MTDLRKHMDPDTLNMILFLKANKNLWADKSIIDEITAEFAAAGETTDDLMTSVAQGASDVYFFTAFLRDGYHSCHLVCTKRFFFSTSTNLYDHGSVCILHTVYDC